MQSKSSSEAPGVLKALDMGIDTHQEPVVYMRSDCHVCLAEGFSASSRVAIASGGKEIIATLNVVDEVALAADHVGFSKIAFSRLGIENGDEVVVRHAPVVQSLSAVRKKIFGHDLSAAEFQDIVEDISAHRYSDIEIAGFVSGCAGTRLTVDEITYLTQAMVNCGKRLEWPGEKRIFDKHCIGGLPGNRTTPLVVSIVSAGGLVMPKTSSRAITSPAGTADTMEALTRVNLSLDEIQEVVRETGACLAWGGAVNLSPADDVLIRIERALDLDGEGQLIASVLSKKIAAGATHVVIDIPVGDTAKMRSDVDADLLASLFDRVGSACGIHVRCVLTDGSKPVGRGIGPVEEARDLLAVLQNHEDAPMDLRTRALSIAAQVFDQADQLGPEHGLIKATGLLESGAAWQQFQRITAAQGGLKSLGNARYSHTVEAARAGILTRIDNRRLARLAKLAGAPFDLAAGLRLHAEVGDYLTASQALFTLFSESRGERDYALDFYHSNPDMFTIE
ncbi:thymidine phosphorylase family protein [Gilvimarinus sp. F26214L]|uniref:thymidine phosphorylase family protein n=1 Tax=Gilvimarinus sp. DZF01 TaxID=3461371 RepID=UPI004045DE87